MFNFLNACRKSRMMWVNGATLLVGVLALVANNDLIADYPEMVAALVAFQGGLNMLLRLLTTKAIS